MDTNYHIRFCTTSDAAEVARMMTTTFLGHDEYGEWARMLVDGLHPDAGPPHTVVAIENTSGAIVSAIPCVPQIFSYGGIPFPVLNMQIVATLPEHREKGLLRAEVETLVERAKQDGVQALVVFGIAGFYPRLRFHPLLPYMGGVVYSAPHLKRAVASMPQSKIVLRPAVLADLPFLSGLHAHSVKRYLVSFPYSESTWKWYGFDYFERNRDLVRVITQPDGTPLGVVQTASGVDENSEELPVFNLELMPGVSWLETLPSVLSCLMESTPSLESLYLALGAAHPSYPFLADIPQRVMPATMGYIRLVDLAGFIRQIAPLLEERIAQSSICGYTRVVRIELYYRKEGLVLTFEKGKLVSVCSQEIEGYQLECERAEIEMPEADFYRLLMGQASVDELTSHFREVNTWNGEEGLAAEFRILLNVLFPKMTSNIYACT